MANLLSIIICLTSYVLLLTTTRYGIVKFPVITIAVVFLWISKSARTRTIGSSSKGRGYPHQVSLTNISPLYISHGSSLYKCTAIRLPDIHDSRHIQPNRVIRIYKMALQVLSLPKLEGFSLQVKIYLAPEDVEKWLAAFKPVFELVSAEPECLFFELYQDPVNPGDINWVENWYVKQ
jgi:hypothetical protein